MTLFTCSGGSIVVPPKGTALLDARDGGQLIVNPPRDVWERSELSSDELVKWSKLVAATGEAMLATLPQLQGGCINYWEAGNWALNDNANPVGKKNARDARSVHLHLLGRSPSASDPDWRWGEAPRFPDYLERTSWTAKFQRLGPSECAEILTRVESTLQNKYEIDRADLKPWRRCPGCGYPTPEEICEECRSTA